MSEKELAIVLLMLAPLLAALYVTLFATRRLSPLISKAVKKEGHEPY